MRHSPLLLVAALALGCGSPPPAARPTETETKSSPAGTETRVAATIAPEPAKSAEPAPEGDAGPKRAKDPSEKIGARHVLIQYIGAERAPANVVRSREQAYALAQEVLRRAKAKDDFARLAVEYSDEPNAGGRGGSLGRFGHGQMVGAFDAAVFKLEVGEISEIVETPFGYHIIQRTE